jgi:hypothetical protein
MLDDIIANIDPDAPLMTMKALRELEFDFEITSDYVNEVNEILDIRVGNALADTLDSARREQLVGIVHEHDAAKIRDFITENVPDWDDVIAGQFAILRGDLIESEGKLDNLYRGVQE